MRTAIDPRPGLPVARVPGCFLTVYRAGALTVRQYSAEKPRKPAVTTHVMASFARSKAETRDGRGGKDGQSHASSDATLRMIWYRTH